MQGRMSVLKKYKPVIIGLSMGLILLVISQWVWAAEANQLNTIEVRSTDPNQIELLLEFSTPMESAKSFSVAKPPAIILDFPATKNMITKERIQQLKKEGDLKNINVIETENKTRMVIDLQHLLPFQTDVKGKVFKITLNAKDVMAESAKEPAASMTQVKTPDRTAHQAEMAKGNQVKSVDFQRGENGEGRVIVNLSSPKAMIDLTEDNGKIRAFFSGISLPTSLAKRYDVTDFGTPIKSFTVTKEGPNVDVNISASGRYEKIAYQMDNQYIIEVKGNGNKAAPVISNNDNGMQYSGQRISLNFQDIEIRKALQILADYAKINLICSDALKGNITLWLQNVPSDQALDIILKSKGLDKRQFGSIILVGPSAELAARDKVELEAQKFAQEMGALQSELIPINYANAADLADIFLKNQGKDKYSLLTSRGSVTVDKRTNTILVQDIPTRLAEVRALTRKLDVAVRQVEISTQIVKADSSFETALGVRFGGAANIGIDRRRLGLGATVEKARVNADFIDALGNPTTPPSSTGIIPPTTNIQPTTLIGPPAPTQLNPTVANSEGLFSDLGVTNLPTASIQTAKIGFALARLPGGTLLDLELDALEYEARTKTVAKPRIVTMDQNKATVEQGVEIPYLEASSSGATSVSYKTAALKLEVTPHITPDDRISMELLISQDTVGPAAPGPGGSTGPTINTNRLDTKVLVDNGETVVLGGIMQTEDRGSWAKVPLLGDLPFIGNMFRNKYAISNPKELIIFLTPRILTPMIKGCE